MQVGDLVRYTDYDTEHKQGVRVTGILISLGESRWGDPLWRVKHIPDIIPTPQGWMEAAQGPGGYQCESMK